MLRGRISTLLPAVIALPCISWPFCCPLGFCIVWFGSFSRAHTQPRSPQTVLGAPLLMQPHCTFPPHTPPGPAFARGTYCPNGMPPDEGSSERPPPALLSDLSVRKGQKNCLLCISLSTVLSLVLISQWPGPCSLRHHWSPCRVCWRLNSVSAMRCLHVELGASNSAGQCPLRALPQKNKASLTSVRHVLPQTQKLGGMSLYPIMSSPGGGSTPCLGCGAEGGGGGPSVGLSLFTASWPHCGFGGSQNTFSQVFIWQPTTPPQPFSSRSPEGRLWFKKPSHKLAFLHSLGSGGNPPRAI